MKRRFKQRICTKCRCNFTKTRRDGSRVRCDKCKKIKRFNSRETTIGEMRNHIHLSKLHKSSTHAAVRQYCRSWNKDIITKCQNCNYNKHVELCHIKGLASYPDSATIGEVNHPDNVLVLCRNCHWEFDNEHLEFENIPKRA